jgi:signal transduction histidine kinase
MAAVTPPPTVPSRWELAAETIAVKIRWFGLIVGYLLVNAIGQADAYRPALNAILALGVLFALLDTYHSIHGRVVFRRYPLAISVMEALFIGLLCYFHGGLESAFRYYYLLSLICCAIRHSSRVTFLTYGLHCASYTALYLALPPDQRQPLTLVFTLVVLGWVTWASDSLAQLLKHVGNHLADLNASLQENQALLEARIAERTRELQEAQAHLLHQEKMAAFGLLAAGIAHEVGNPLTSISSLVQMLKRRDTDPYTQEKLALVSGQLQRIQGTLRELINFSRPASQERSRVAIAEIVDEALNIAKYYKRTKGRIIEPRIPANLPALYAVRDQLVQVILNLVLNAVDATDRGGRIDIEVERTAEALTIAISDNGPGIAPEHQSRLFQPYFTTKRHGTGLGLFVTRKLVSDNGGTVEYSSQPDGGARFCICLPVEPDRGSRIEPASVVVLPARPLPASLGVP